MSKQDLQTQVTVQVESCAPRNSLYATSYQLTLVEDVHLIIFSNPGGQVHGVSISKLSVLDNFDSYRKFVEKLGAPKSRNEYVEKSRITDYAITPSDNFNVSHRGPEAEFAFSAFSIHDLITFGHSKDKAQKSIRGYPVLIVRCSVGMMHELIFNLLASHVE